MEKYINQWGKECYRGCSLTDTFCFELFHEVPEVDEDTQWALHTDLGSITVVDRMTGYGFRDIETGFRDIYGEFWLASGDRNVLASPATTLGEAIEWIKRHANTCTGKESV